MVTEILGLVKIFEPLYKLPVGIFVNPRLISEFINVLIILLLREEFTDKTVTPAITDGIDIASIATDRKKGPKSPGLSSGALLMMAIPPIIPATPTSERQSPTPVPFFALLKASLS
jgi:hypothetical protein